MFELEAVLQLDIVCWFKDRFVQQQFTFDRQLRLAAEQ